VPAAIELGACHDVGGNTDEGNGLGDSGDIHTDLRRVLIVANQTIGSDELTAAVSERVAAGPCKFHLLVPIPPTPPSAISVGLAAVESATTAFMVLPDLRQLSEERLAFGLQWLESLGAEGTGELGSGDTLAAVTAVAERGEVDEVIVSTLPSRISRWLHQDLPSKLAKNITIPVVVVTTATHVPA
jgi:nucleotide-binding universal stress UspA family protein